MAEMKLLPFTVESLEEAVTYIPYGIEQCEAPEIWQSGERGENVVVAVLDTGVDMNHPDLKNNIIGGRNFTPEGNYKDYTDRNGHGTHCAGTIAASGEILGVAPDAKLLICKVLDRHGSGNYWSIIEGIRYATKWKGPNGEKVRIISMSLGGSENDSKLEEAILEAAARGILIVVASGNEGDNNEETYEDQSYPSMYNECITVAACNEEKKLAAFSNNHKQVDVIAAGVQVLSTYPQSKYAKLSGTSMATPHVSGMLALLINLGEKRFKRELTESELYALLTKCCCSLGYQASTEGHGLPTLTRFFTECE